MWFHCVSDRMLRSAQPFCHNVWREQLENMPRHSTHPYDLKRMVDGYYSNHRYQMNVVKRDFRIHISFIS